MSNTSRTISSAPYHEKIPTCRLPAGEQSPGNQISTGSHDNTTKLRYKGGFGDLDNSNDSFSYIACQLIRRPSHTQTWGFALSLFEGCYLIFADVSHELLHVTTAWACSTSATPDPQILFNPDLSMKMFQEYFQQLPHLPQSLSTVLPGDMIVAINGCPTTSFSDLKQITNYLKQCSQLTIVAIRHQTALLSARSVWSKVNDLNKSERIYRGAQRSYFVLKHYLPGTSLPIPNARDEKGRSTNTDEYQMSGVKYSLAPTQEKSSGTMFVKLGSIEEDETWSKEDDDWNGYNTNDDLSDYKRYYTEEKKDDIESFSEINERKLSRNGCRQKKTTMRRFRSRDDTDVSIMSDSEPYGKIHMSELWQMMMQKIQKLVDPVLETIGTKFCQANARI